MEIARKIIESKNPPSNREVWWFDTNTDTILRFKNTKWEPVIPHKTQTFDDMTSSWEEIHLKYETIPQPTSSIFYDGYPDFILNSAGNIVIGRDTQSLGDRLDIDLSWIRGLDQITSLYINASSNASVAVNGPSTALRYLCISGKVSSVKFSYLDKINVLETLILPDSLNELTTNGYLAKCSNLRTVRLGNIGKINNFSPALLPCGQTYGLSKILGPSSVEGQYLVHDNKLIYYANWAHYEDWTNGDAQLNLPEVKIIESNAIRYLPSWQEYEDEPPYGHVIHIPSSVEEIKHRAFGFSSPGISRFEGKFASADGKFCIKDTRLIMYAGCNLDTTVTIPLGITSIANGAFQFHSGISTVHIPETVTYLENLVFHKCSSLNEIYIRSQIPPIIDERTFEGISDSLVIYVPVGSADSYKKATNWSMYADKITEYNF